MPDVGYTELNETSGGNRIATEIIVAGANPTKAQRGKLMIGAFGVDDGDVSAANPLPVTVPDSVLTRDFFATGQTIYSNASGDFVATANSGAKTITLSSYANAVLSAAISTRNFVVSKIKKFSSTGAVSDVVITNVSFAAGVLTLADMAANFNAGDSVVVTLVGPDKAYDPTLDARKSIDSSFRTATIDSITSKLSSEHVMVNGVALVPKWKYKSALATSGNNEVVALVSGKKIRVLAFRISFSGTVNAQFRTSTAGAYLDILHYGAASVEVKGEFNPLGHFETVAGEALGINLSAATAVEVWVQYVEV